MNTDFDYKFLENIVAVSNALKSIGKIANAKELERKYLKYCEAKNIIDEAHGDDDFECLDLKADHNHVLNGNEVHDEMVKLVMKEAGSILGIKKVAENLSELDEDIENNKQTVLNIIGKLKPRKFYYRDERINTLRPTVECLYGNSTHGYQPVFNIELKDGVKVLNNDTYSFFKTLTGLDIFRLSSAILKLKSSDDDFIGYSSESREKFKNLTEEKIKNPIDAANNKINYYVGTLQAWANDLISTDINSLQSLNRAYQIIDVFDKKGDWQNNFIINFSSKDDAAIINNVFSSLKNDLLTKINSIKSQKTNENKNIAKEFADKYSMIARVLANKIKTGKPQYQPALDAFTDVVNMLSSNEDISQISSNLSLYDERFNDVKNWGTIYNEDKEFVSKASVNSYEQIKTAGVGAAAISKTQTTAKPTATPTQKAQPQAKKKVEPKKEETPIEKKTRLYQEMNELADKQPSDVKSAVVGMQKALNAIGEWLSVLGPKLGLTQGEVNHYSKILKETGTKGIEGDYTADGVWGNNTQNAVNVAHGLCTRMNKIIALSKNYSKDSASELLNNAAKNNDTKQVNAILGGISDFEPVKFSTDKPQQSQIAQTANSIKTEILSILSNVKPEIEKILKETSRMADVAGGGDPTKGKQEEQKPAAKQNDDKRLSEEANVKQAYGQVPFDNIVDLDFIAQYYPGPMNNVLSELDRTYLGDLTRSINVNKLKGDANLLVNSIASEAVVRRFKNKDKVDRVWGSLEKSPPSVQKLLKTWNEESVTQTDEQRDTQSYINLMYRKSVCKSYLEVLAKLLNAVIEEFNSHVNERSPLGKQADNYYTLWINAIKDALRDLKG